MTCLKSVSSPNIWLYSLCDCTVVTFLLPLCYCEPWATVWTKFFVCANIVKARKARFWFWSWGFEIRACLWSGWMLGVIFYVEQEEKVWWRSKLFSLRTCMFSLFTLNFGSMRALMISSFQLWGVSEHRQTCITQHQCFIAASASAVFVVIAPA